MPSAACGGARVASKDLAVLAARRRESPHVVAEADVHRPQVRRKARRPAAGVFSPNHKRCHAPPQAQAGGSQRRTHFDRMMVLVGAWMVVRSCVARTTLWKLTERSMQVQRSAVRLSRTVRPSAVRRSLVSPTGAVFSRAFGTTGVACAAADAAALEDRERMMRVLSSLDTLADAEDLARVYTTPLAGDGVAPMALVKIGGEVLQDQMADLVSNVRFMRKMGMRVILVHGGGPQLNAELAKLGVEPQYVGGHRVTDERTLEIASRVFTGCSTSLATALREGGVSARVIPVGSFHAKVADGGKLGLVGEIQTVKAESIHAALDAGEVPVLCPLGVDMDNKGGVLNINADVAARMLAMEARPNKVVFLSAGGGFKDDGKIMPELNMALDYDRLASKDYTGRQGTLLKLREVKALTDVLPLTTSVVICAPRDLPLQLVSSRGPGTQIRRGVKGKLLASPGAADTAAVDALLSEAHGRPGLTAAELARRHGGRVAGFVVAGDHECVAVVTEVHKMPDTNTGAVAEFGAYRLSAIVSRRSGLDSGAEVAVWKELGNAYPQLWWVTRPAPQRASGQAAEVGTPAASKTSASTPGPANSAVDCLTFHRASRHTVGMVRVEPDAKPVDTSGLSEEQQIEILARASAIGTTDEAGVVQPPAMVMESLLSEGMFVPSAGGPADATHGRGLAGHACVMWWGFTGMFETEEVIQTSQRARTATNKRDKATFHPADDTDLVGWDGKPIPSSPVASSPVRIPVIPPPPATASKPMSIGLIGARGYTGRELVTLIAEHSQFRVGLASSRAFDGMSVSSALAMDPSIAERACTPGLKFMGVTAEQLATGYGMPDGEDFAAFVLALPNGHADSYVGAIRSVAPKAPIVDLSADKRFDLKWAYGMPERHGARPLISQSIDISNPGCYATAVQVGLMPLVDASNGPALLDPARVATAFGVSGYSGAGVTPSDKNDPDVLRDNLLPYSLVGHIHEREASTHLKFPVAFMPTVAPYFRGISVSLSAFVRDRDGFHSLLASRYPSMTIDKAGAQAAASMAQEYFVHPTRGGPEPLVRVTRRSIDVRTHGSNSHGVTVGGFQYDSKTGRLAWVSVIDNLGKGAAVQALQNLNLALGLDEYEGLRPDTPIEF
jgi:N-acetyl-gamma-glutamyl-phosphate reductase